MPNFLDVKSDFLDKVIFIIEENLADEDFGVSELADQIGMSRSNLLRKVQKLTDLSVSVLIRQVRLHKAKQLLQNDTFIVSEVSYKVGFNSVSYFIKCYREQYGYPPGEEGKRTIDEPPPIIDSKDIKEPIFKRLMMPLILVIILIAALIFVPKKKQGSSLPPEKSIAVLPFKNDSGDSTNVYIINGLMEAILNNLQKIEDLRVISRTSVEKYRDRTKTIAEISEELDVNYVLEGSGQKVGDQILLAIQLIEAPRDNHLWSEQYERVTTDIFQLQAEVAKDIAQEIEVIITPEEVQRIEKVPTDNIVAYDHYLRGLDLTQESFSGNLEDAIKYFKMAIDEDPDFAEAHATVAICYYYLDIFRAQKQYGEEVNTYADKAMLLDAELASSLIAKGLFYMHDTQYELAAEYFEKALEFNPNSASANNLLSDIYTTFLPNTEKYLMHALRGIKLDRTTVDSVTTSFSYLHLSNALAQTGFIDEAEHYIQKSLEFDSTNLFSQYVYAYIRLAKNNDFPQAVDRLKEVLSKDTTRLDIIQEVAKVLYTIEDYETAYLYYDVFVKAKEEYGLNIFEGEDIKIAFVFSQVGQKDRAVKYLEQFKAYADADKTIYQSLSLSAYYAISGDVEKGIEYLKEFSTQTNYHYWFLIWLKKDPILRIMAEHPDFNSTIEKIDNQFWQEHKRTRKMLEEEGLL